MSKTAWFILGLILGAALGLIIATMTERHDGPPPETAAAPAAAPAPEEAPAAPAEVATVRPPRPARTVAPPRVREDADDDAQVAEDAAAAGMTSRAQRPAPEAPAPSEPQPASDSTPG